MTFQPPENPGKTHLFSAMYRGGLKPYLYLDPGAPPCEL